MISLPLGPFISVVVRRDDVCGSCKKSRMQYLFGVCAANLDGEPQKQVCTGALVLRCKLDFWFHEPPASLTLAGCCLLAHLRVRERLCMGERAHAGVTCERVCIRDRFRSCRACACRPYALFDSH